MYDREYLSEKQQKHWDALAHAKEHAAIAKREEDATMDGDDEINLDDPDVPNSEHPDCKVYGPTARVRAGKTLRARALYHFALGCTAQKPI